MRIHITDHALLRYAERVEKDFTVKTIQNAWMMGNYPTYEDFVYFGVTRELEKDYRVCTKGKKRFFIIAIKNSKVIKTVIIKDKK